MKRDELKTLLQNVDGADKIIDQIMTSHGKDIEDFKTSVNNLTAERDSLKTSLSEYSENGAKYVDPEKLEFFKTFDKAEYEKSRGELNDLRTYKSSSEETLKKMQSDYAEKERTLAIKYAVKDDLIKDGVKHIDLLESKINYEKITRDEEKGLQGYDEQKESLRTAYSDLWPTTNTEPPKSGLESNGAGGGDLSYEAWALQRKNKK